ncbi:MAG: hypothetical protein ACYSO1_06320 [Planctomycetota bacterium]
MDHKSSAAPATATGQNSNDAVSHGRGAGVVDGGDFFVVLSVTGKMAVSWNTA